MKNEIAHRLTHKFAPLQLEVKDESEQHRGHGGWREGGETHFRIYVVSAAFSGKTRLERHRMVNAAVQSLFDQGLHALAIQARAPEELAF